MDGRNSNAARSLDVLSCNRILGSMDQEYQKWRPQFMELQRHLRPTSGSFVDTPNDGREPDYKTQVDGTPSRAIRILAAGMTSGLTSPSRPWFKLGTPDDDLNQFEPVKEWLAQVESRMMAVFAKSNIYGVYNRIYEELGCYATGCAALLSDRDTIMNGRFYTMGEYFIASGSNGHVNRFGRKSWYTVDQLVEEFGLENVSDNARALYQNNNLDSWLKVNHLITPNPKIYPGSDLNKHMPFVAKYWEDGCPEGQFLRESGFRQFPVIAPRWDLRTSNDYYGMGPGWEALGDVRMLQKLQKDKLLAIDLVNNPPMQTDSTVDEVNVLPGGITRSSSASPNAGVKPSYQIEPDIKALLNAIAETKGDVNAWFYTDLFLMVQQAERGDKTAREIVELHEEKLLMLGPVIERLEAELTDPTIDRTFDIMLEARLIPPPPPEVQGMELKVEYISILAQAQKMVGTTALQQYSNFIVGLSQPVPEILDTTDFDEIAMQYGTLLGVPPKVVRSPDQRDLIRKQRAQAQAKQAQLQQSMAAIQGAKTMADTQLGQNSALDALMGTNGASSAPGGPQ